MIESSLKRDRDERAEMGLGYSPAWADAWGEDEYGVFASFVVNGVEQRMRWIRPGTVAVRSPVVEPNRDGETQREIELTEGFWMADTPCTQVLWTAVTGENPSRFKSPRRPVESVSWDDVQRFIDELNHRCAGLNAELPSEAQWEHACRAGTTTETYAGPLKLLGEFNAPILHEIAWYGGNSGVDFDLAEGHDSSTWGEKHFPHTDAGTREVGLKRPNRWGLYDTLGNVWEWCQDLHEIPPPPGVNLPKPMYGRAARGGSWATQAHRVQAGWPMRFLPGTTGDYLGFRIVRSHKLNSEVAEIDRSVAPHTPFVVDGDEVGHALVLQKLKAGTNIIEQHSDDGIRVVIEPRTGVELVFVPGGRFTMGLPPDAEGRDRHQAPRHEVQLEGFHLARTPVTNEQYARFMAANPAVARPIRWDNDDFNQPTQPVVGISWFDARAFCDWAGLVLPTEAQWEYACRAGTTTAYWSGDSEADLKRVAWYRANSGLRPHTVSKKQPNPFGLYDMHGNVLEWCLDDYGKYSTPPRPRDGLRHFGDGTARGVLRGGDYSTIVADALCAGVRYVARREDRGDVMGFRPAAPIHLRDQ